MRHRGCCWESRLAKQGKRFLCLMIMPQKCLEAFHSLQKFNTSPNEGKIRIFKNKQAKKK